MLFAQLYRGMQQYQMTYGRLPQVKVPAGPVLKSGSTGKRVDLLRQRLGLSPGGGYDTSLFQAVATYQTVHGLGRADGVAGKATIASLNRGSQHYLRRIAINVERAWRLPQTRTFDRYVVVDSGAAEAYLFDRDRIADGMRVIVGSPKTSTPMIAVIMRNAKANPYWHVPPELVRSLTAKRISKEGLSYLKSFHYEVLSDWGPNAQIVDPKTINWKAIASGKREPSDSRPSASWPVEFDGHDEVRDAQRLWHLPARHAAEGKVRRRSLDQQRLRAAGGLSPLCAAGCSAGCRSRRRAGSSASTCPGRSRSISPI